MGENHCYTPQEICPRKDGEGYEKCKSVCNQPGHAEEQALNAWKRTQKDEPRTAILEGHSYFCHSCIQQLRKIGVKYFVIGNKGVGFK